MSVGWLLLLAGGSSLLGSLGGIGGALFLVPLLILVGVPPEEAAPLGMLTVAAGSLAAGPRQLGEGLVHHRLGMAIEVPASAGAIVGALAASALPPQLLTAVLAVVALASAVASVRGRGVRNLPQREFLAEHPGEWPGTLGGSYRMGDEVVPYQARRVPLGLTLCSLAGLVSGMAGVGGGFIKTPVMRQIMAVPVKVAAATSTFTVGVTAATALVVFSIQGRLEVTSGPPVVLAALAGGLVGARVQSLAPPRATRVVLSVLLGVIALILLGQTFR